jgi:hypothetical protein
VGVAAAPAATQSDDDVWSRKLAIDAHAGLGTRYGLGGVSVEWAPVKAFAIAAGGGGSWAGPQFALLPKVRALLGRTAFALEVGPSWGTYQASSDFIDPAWVGTYTAAWLNADVGVEHRWPCGFEFRVYLGAAMVLAANRVNCWQLDPFSGPSACASAASQTGRTLPYVGVALGYAFLP